MVVMNLPENVVKKVEAIPVLSRVASDLITLVNSPDYSLDAVARLVSQDAFLTGKVLRLANSAAYARGNTFSSVQRAVPHIGGRAVMGLVLGTSAKELYNDGLDGYAAEQHSGLWEHSLHTALAAKEISRFARTPVVADEAFTAGLLHDVGKAVLSEFLQVDPETEDRKNYLKTERERSGADHATVSHAIVTHWNLPDPIKQVALLHHAPAHADEAYRPLVYAVHLADFIAQMHGKGTGIDALAYTLDPSYKDYIAITSEQLDNIIFLIEDEYQAIVAQMKPE